MDRWNKPYPQRMVFYSDTIQDAVQLKDGTLLDYRFNIETGLLEHETSCEFLRTPVKNAMVFNLVR